MRLPLPRKNSNTLDEFTDLSFDFKVPPRMILSGIELHVKVTPTTAVTAATRISKAIASVTATNGAEDVLEVKNSSALPMACAISQAMKDTQSFSTTPRSVAVARDPNVKATGTAQYGTFKLFSPLPGKAFRLNVELAEMQTQFAGITAVSVDVGAVIVFDEHTLATDDRFKIESEMHEINSRAYNGVTNSAIWCPNELNSATGATTITQGTPRGKSELAIMQEDFNDQLRGLCADGSASGTSTKSVKDPVTDANIYGVITKGLPSPGVVSADMRGSTKVGFFNMYYRGVESIPE